MIHTTAEQVLNALTDYVDVRPALHPSQIDEYRVEAGGAGAGTTVCWRMTVGKKRAMRCVIEVSRPSSDQLVERDTQSDLVTVWTVADTSEGRCAVRVRTTFERSKASGGLYARALLPVRVRKIHEATLVNLRQRFETPAKPADDTPAKPADGTGDEEPRPDESK